MKAELFEYVANVAGKRFDPDVLTITWARRFADYKRAWLILMDKDRITKLLDENKIQIIFAGKFHLMMLWVKKCLTNCLTVHTA